MWDPKRVTKIYPPCDTTDITNNISLTSSNNDRENLLISFAQFRPEKYHELQLQVWKDAISKLPPGSKFIMIGATRGIEDEKIVQELKRQRDSLGLSDSVDFAINKPWPEVLSYFKRAKVAIHTMKEEHFGISIVEMMAAGLIVIAHDSAGPKMDIIGGASVSVGYLANNQARYTESVITAMNNYNSTFH